ncbi:MAG: 1-acyl-sn-glycerol-3-phosphate acyltransferase [Spirochaetaceae bacterium]|nr:1-acyl-sn-glycerol-3-phosphate acyltransferase [Spirochaetaceae bacterium]
MIRQVTVAAKAPTEVTPETVNAEGRLDLLPYVNKIVESLMLPGSGIRGVDNLYRLLKLAKAGHSCLLMVEHYSNLDLPEFYYFLGQHGERGEELQKAVIAIAGMKLTVDNPMVAAFASIYPRIIICPSRTITNLDAEKDKDRLLALASINRAAAKALNDAKKRGKIILVYPSGTRYRPWEPDSKRGVREIETYVKGFDYMCFVSKNGVAMRMREDAKDDMLADYMVPDVVRFTVSEPVSCEAFREEVRAAMSEDADKKQAVVDEIMRRLDEMHNAAEQG